MTRARVTLTSTIRASASLADTVRASSSLADTVRASSSLADTVRASASLTTQARIAATGAGVLPGVVADGEATVVASSPAYVIVVKTDNAGTSADDQFTFPATGTYEIDWGDSTVETRTGAATHTYPAAGTYTISVTGGLTRVAFNNTGDRLKLLDIEAWGECLWSSLEGAYWGCANLTGSAVDVPDLSLVINTQRAFQNASLFNGDLSAWNVDNVASFALMFSGASSFTSDLSAWDVAKSVSCAFMFNGASSFTSDLSAWNVGNVANFAQMFRNASSFTSDLSAWNVAKGTNFSGMLRDNTSFNGDIGPWDVSAATTLQDIFRDSVFNRSLASWPLRTAGVVLTDSINQSALPVGMSAENYSRTLIGWANRVATLGGPTGTTLGANNRRYTSTVYGGTPYDNAVAARAFLVLPVVDGGAGWTISGDALL